MVVRLGLKWFALYRGASLFIFNKGTQAKSPSQHTAAGISRLLSYQVLKFQGGSVVAIHLWTEDAIDGLLSSFLHPPHHQPIILSHLCDLYNLFIVSLDLHLSLLIISS